MPRAEDMRPICATSSLLKLIEARFTRKLVINYTKIEDPISKTQVGFMPNMSTQINIFRLLNLIAKTYKSWPEKIPLVPFHSKCDEANSGDSSAILFIDYRSVYNSSNRKRLFEMLVDEKFLAQEEANFLEWFYGNQSIYLEDSRFSPQYGLPQGGLNSPILFNYAMFFLMRELREKAKDIAHISFKRTSSISP